MRRTPRPARVSRHRVATTFLAVAAFGLAIGLALPAGAEGAPAPSPAPELRVGVTPDYPPLVFRRGGKLAGVEPDFARHLAEELGRPLAVIELPWNELIPALNEDRIDVIMSGMSVTAERSRRVAFTNPYLRVGQMSLFRKEDAARMRDPSALGAKGSRVGVVRGTTGEAYARRNLEHATLVPFDSIDPAIAALRDRELDAFLHDAPTIWHIVGGLDSDEKQLTSLYRFLTEEHLAWAVRKGDEGALRDRLNEVLAGWETDGTLEWTLDRWIRVRKVMIEPDR